MTFDLVICHIDDIWV